MTDLDKKNYGPENFLQPQAFYSVEIPESIKSSTYAGYYSYYVYGYRSTSDFENRILHNVIDYGSSQNIFENGLEVPLINKFEQYQLFLMATDRENYEMSRMQRGLEFKTFSEMDLYSSGSSITTTGTYDYVLFDYGFYDVIDTDLIGMQWFFYKQPGQNVVIPYHDFEMPEALRNILEDANVGKVLDIDDDNSGISATLVKKEKQKDYRKLMFQHANRYHSNGEWYALRLKFNNKTANNANKAANNNIFRQSKPGLRY